MALTTNTVGWGNKLVTVFAFTPASKTNSLYSVPRSHQRAFTSFQHQDIFLVTYHLCTAILVMLNQFCTLIAKTRAIPSLHRDNFLRKVSGYCPVAASGNAYSLNRRAVSGNAFYVRMLANSDSLK